MSAEYQASPDALSQLREAFQFIKHDREDVRKMAVHGIAEQSKDNRDLWCFLSSKEDGDKAVETLLQYLHVGCANILGDILTILINVSAEGSCAERLVQHKVVRKAMRLLDGVGRSAMPATFARNIEEMTLMLLNNLTASHVFAIADLLQKEDEDMRGFYLGKLQTYYTALSPSAGAVTEAGERGEEEGHPQRDLRKWILQILLNATRTYDGQELLLEDEDWRATLDACLTSAHTVHRLLAAQCFRNCACSQKPQFAMLLRSEALLIAVHRLATRDERNPEVQLCLVEFVASMLESEEGMARLEGVNAKRLLADTTAESRAMHAREGDAACRAATGPSSRVEVLDADDQPVAPGVTSADDVDGDSAGAVVAPPLAVNVCETLERHVLPYLDDIVDAYLAPGSDGLD